MSSFQLVLSEFVPDARLSLNGRRRTHWATISKLNQAVGFFFLQAVQEYRRLHGGGLPHFPAARVRIEFVFPQQRRRDPDGLAGRAKPILDLLVAHKVVPDDDAAHLELEVVPLVEPGTGHETRIHVEERPG